MENVYDIRKNKGLYFVLSKTHIDNIESAESIQPSALFERSVIVIHLYYEDTICRYTGYLADIPAEIEVIVVSPSQIVLDTIAMGMEKNRNIKYVLKRENRGRDISTLLVNGKEYIQEKEYICFIHDKKEHQVSSRSDETSFWIDNIWGNTIASAMYIENVLRLLEERKDMGILFVPEPIGQQFDTWSGQGWHGSYLATLELYNKMKLRSDLIQEKPPISIGTAFWFRRKALNKLFEYGWKDNDFDERKLETPSYISYAIERIFPYVAQDAGFLSGTIMTTEYAEKQTAVAQNISYSYSRLFNELIGITSQYECDHVYARWGRIQEISRQYNNIYIYGAGKWGRICRQLFRLAGKPPTGFVVTKKEECRNNDCFPLYQVDKLKTLDDDYMVIVSVKDYEQRMQIKSVLDQYNYNYELFWD